MVHQTNIIKKDCSQLDNPFYVEMRDFNGNISFN